MNLDFHTFMRGIGEFSATMFLMLIGCMGSAVNAQDANLSMMSSLHNGMTITIIMHIFGFISGAHANPCISIACCLLGYISNNMMMLYITCQLIGASCGYFILLQLLPQEIVDQSKQGVCMVEPLSGLSGPQILGIECFLTAVLVFGWCAVWDVRNCRYLDSVTLRMGFLVSACCFAGGHLTGASMNPAKTLIPALFKRDPNMVILQLIGQIVAALCAPTVWYYVFVPQYRSVPMMSLSSSSSSL